MFNPKEEPNFIGDWVRERKLGTGGFGQVNLWKNSKTNQSVAIKKFLIFEDGSELTEKHCERWKNEVDLMNNTVHNENIVRTVKIEPQSFLDTLAQTKNQLSKKGNSNLPLLCLEFCELGDLRKLLNRPANCCGLPEGQVRGVLKSLKNAISYLHSLKITHRDIKPENIVMKKEGNRIQYKLTDLGYAKSLDKQSLNASLVGTLEYIAPDLLYCEKYNNSVDYWSFGIIAFEVLCGVRPFIPHLPLAKWLLQVQQKKSQHIAITEDNTENFHYHSELFPETHISSCLKGEMEKWLRLALEWNPKQRGFVYQLGDKEVTEVKPKSVKFADNINPSENPQSVLKIFSLIDNILDKKVLTLFSLFNYRNFHFEINEDTTLTDIMEFIETETGILKEEICMVLPLEQKLNKIEETTKAIDLYIPNFYGRPMIYVIRDKFILQSIIKPAIPASVSDVFQNIKTKLKPHALGQFIRNAYFFIRNEQTAYVTALEGIKNYALHLNEEIVKNRPAIYLLNRLSNSMIGSIESYKLVLNHTKDKMETNKLLKPLSASTKLWDDQAKKTEDCIGAISKVAEKLKNRYESVLRRSREIVSHAILKEIDQDYYNIKSLDSRFEIVRTQILDKKTHDKSHFDMLQSVYECLKKRDILLRDSAFVELQQHLIDIKAEMKEIKKALEKASEHAEKYKKEVSKILIEHQDNVWNMMENLNERKMHENHIPDIDEMLSFNGFEIGGTVTTLQNVVGSPIDKSFLCFGEGPEINSLLEDNDALLLTTEDLIKDGFEILKSID